MLVFVVGLLLYPWFVLRSASGTVVSVIVTGFLLCGAWPIFQYHAERELDVGSRV